MCQSHHINLLAFSGTFSRAKPLTSYKNKSIEFFRLFLLCYYFSVKILGNCTWKLWATPCLLQTDRCHLSSQTTPLFPLSLPCAATHLLLLLHSWRSHSLPNFLLLLNRNICLSLTQVYESRKLSPGFLGQCRPFPTPVPQVTELWLCWQTLGILSRGQQDWDH